MYYLKKIIRKDQIMTIMIGTICKLKNKKEGYNETCFVSWNKKTIKITAFNEKRGFVEELTEEESNLTPIGGFQSDLLPKELIVPHQLVLKNPQKKKNVTVKFQNENGKFISGIIAAKANGLLIVDTIEGTKKIHMNLVDIA